MPPIYLDYNATTPIDSRVADAIVPFLREHFGNPSSGHAYGTRAAEAVATARQQVADLLGAKPNEIVFTGGGSEANNQALKGVVEAARRGWLRRLLGRGESPHIITSAVEHPAIEQPCKYLRKRGCRVTVVPVDEHGLVNPEEVERALQKGASLVSIMHSNNEVGTLQPIREIASLCRKHGALCHTDAAQSSGKVEVNVEELGVDLLSIAGHKLYAPKGVGALYVREGVNVEPLIHGAGHEAGRRAGTENVAYLAGLGEACRLAMESLPEATAKLRRLRDRLWDSLRERLGERIRLNGHPEKRLPNTLHVSFLGETGAELLARTPEVAASTGSACHEGRVHLSGVLKAMGLSEEEGRGAVRLSVGRFTTEEEVDRAADFLLR